MIDTGEGKPIWSRLLASVLSSEAAILSHVLITHWHHDHVGGVNDVSSHSPHAIIHKNGPVAGQSDIKDGQKFVVKGATLRAFHCPGHTKDHMAFILEEEDAMFTGDNLLGHGTAVFEDLASYMDSLERMKQQFSGRAYPAHGAVVPDGKLKIDEYIAHRKQREEEIIQSLSSREIGNNNNNKNNNPHEFSNLEDSTPTAEGPGRTVAELVRTIYKDVPETLHPAAENGVAQVLLKLEGEGRAFRTGADGKWKWKLTRKLRP